MTRNRLFALIAVLLLVCGSVYYLRQTPPPAAPLDAAPSKAIASTGVGALARIEPRSRVIRISHNAGPEGAKISTLLVEEGQDVEKGQTLAVLADYPLKQAELLQADANVKALEARLKVERLNQDYTQKTLARRRKLISANAISVNDMEKTEQAYKQAQALVGDLQAQIDSAKAVQMLAQANLDNMTITAPLNGTILRIVARTGERIGSDSLLEMADLQQLDAVAEIYERDIAQVKIGQPATVTIPDTEQTYHGIVREIGFQVRGNDLNDTDPLADKDNRIVAVRVTLDDAAVSGLRHQLYRQVQILIAP